MKSVFCLALIASALSPFAALGADLSCKDVFTAPRVNLNALRYDLKSEENPSDWRVEFIEEQKRHLAPLFAATRLDQAAMVVQERLKLKGWKISHPAVDTNGNITDFAVRRLIDPPYRRSQPRGDWTTTIYERENKILFLQTIKKEGVLIDLEALLVVKNGRAPRKQFELQMQPLSIGQWPLHLTEDQRDEYYDNPPTTFFASGPEAFAQIDALIGEMSDRPPVDVTPQIEAWKHDEGLYLKRAGQLRLRNTLKNIVRFHVEQRAKTKKKTSHFIYDDRGDFSLESKVNVPGVGVIAARPGSQLMNINDYCDIRVVVDVPRSEDNDVRVWIWDGRSRSWSESYVLALNQKSQAPGALEGSPSLYLSLMFGRLLNIEEQMEMKLEELN